MQSQLSFFGSIAFSFMAWGIVVARYVWPELHFRPRAGALRPLLILHSFRFIGLAFLVPGGWCRPACRLPSRIRRRMGTSLRQCSPYLRSHRCPVRPALPFGQKLGVGRNHAKRLLQVVGRHIGELLKIAVRPG